VFMSGESRSQVDVAALLGAVVAATLSMSGVPGPWVLLSSIVGICLGLALLAFVHLPTDDQAWRLGPMRLWMRAAAIAASGAFVTCIVLAWVLQSTVVRWLMPAATIDEVSSATTTTAFPIVWIISGVAIYLVIRQRVIKKRTGVTNTPKTN
jgi:hypothetical protein